MQCTNHPDTSALDRCTGCAESFCFNCLVEIHGQKYCGSCKVMTVKRKSAPPMTGGRAQFCNEAREALIWAIVASSFCCCGVLYFVALTKASGAKSHISRNPTLDGKGVATAAQVISIAGIIVWIIGMMLRFAGPEM